jgi:trehalose 6-phosphate phosphatase
MPDSPLPSFRAGVRLGPPPALRPDHALFLDIDGTLLDLAPTPEAVRVDASLVALLPELVQRLDGAVALITGRSIGDADRLFPGLRLPIAGQHGCERRDATGTLHMHAADPRTLARLRTLFADFASRHEGLRVEDKGASLALHYRQAPGLASHVHRTLRDAVAGDAAGGFRLQPGKKLLELRPGGRDKGTAIREFLREPPFAGRQAVFVGDDAGDEHGFAVVAARKGLAIKVGPGPTRARFRLPDVAAVRGWLAAPAADTTALHTEAR